MVAKRHPSEPDGTSFYKRLSLDKLIAQQGTGPVNLDKVREEFADLWADDESIETFQAFLLNA
jgi:hypothetical protein